MGLRCVGAWGMETGGRVKSAGANTKTRDLYPLNRRNHGYLDTLQSDCIHAQNSTTGASQRFDEYSSTTYIFMCITPTGKRTKCRDILFEFGISAQ